MRDGDPFDETGGGEAFSCLHALCKGVIDIAFVFELCAQLVQDIKFIFSIKICEE